MNKLLYLILAIEFIYSSQMENNIRFMSPMPDFNMLDYNLQDKNIVFDVILLLIKEYYKDKMLYFLKAGFKLMYQKYKKNSSVKIC